jgi:1-pyrroline-4-hydroxy-2-carboxylate deaminase
MNWNGVMPALTTAFNPDLSIDHSFVARHAQWLIENGCTGIICLGSLAEAATLNFDEKVAILRTVVTAVGGSVPVVSAISALSTAEAVALAKAAHQGGCSGLMILPQYVYRGDWRENKAHIAAVLNATPLPGMLYNNPVAYGVDYLPEHVAEFAAEFSNFAAVKESSTDVRRVTAIRSLLADRLAIFVGVDDAIVEGIAAGAVGWVAGLVNAFPRESVDLFNHARAGKTKEDGSEIHPAHQAGPAGSRRWKRTRASSAPRGSRQRAGRDTCRIPRSAGKPPCSCDPEHAVYLVTALQK